MSGELSNQNHDHEDQESALNWSVSGISAASGFDPDLYTIEMTHSRCTTPDSSKKPHARDEIDLLINSVRDLRTSLATISEKSVTPLSSPRTGSAKVPTTPETVQKRPLSTGQTPPVKDSGPADSSAHKLEHMRKMLKDLEEAKNQYKVNRSKIPKRSLTFQNSNNSSTLSSKASINDQFKEMSDFLDKVRASKSSNNSSETTVIEQNTKAVIEDLQKQVEAEKNTVMDLTSQKKVLEAQMKKQADELVKLRDNCAQKDKMLLELKSCWSQVVAAMTSEREQLMAQNEAVVNEIHAIKAEQDEIKKQFFVCQEELEKALDLASDFKQKVDEDEKIKQDLLDQVLLERQLKLREAEKAKVVTDEIEAVRRQLQDMDANHKELLNEKLTIEKTLAIERSDKERTKNELLGRLKTKEEALHDFYGNQMEAILGEKISTLQNYVKDWELKVSQEKQEAVNALKAEHNRQIEALRRQFAQLEAQIKASEAIQKASKREAAALKGQLGWNPSEATSTDDEEALHSHRSLPPVLLNNKGHPSVRRSTTSRMSSITVTNDLKQPRPEQRPCSAGAKFSVPSYDISPERLQTETADDTDASLLTSKEKKDLVKAFIKQFLEDNPDAVLDVKLMAGLSEKANKLIDQSFSIDEEDLSKLTPVRDLSTHSNVRRRIN